MDSEARNMKMDHLRAFFISALLLHIPCWIAIDDEIIRCVCGIVVLLDGAHS